MKLFQVPQDLQAQTVIAQNDNWQTTDALCGAPAVSCGGSAEITATGLDPCVGNMTGCAQESAIYITLRPGSYTAIVSAAGGGQVLVWSRCLKLTSSI